MPCRTSTRVSRLSSSYSSRAARACSNAGSQLNARTLPHTAHTSLHGDGQRSPSARRSSSGRPPNALQHAALSSSMRGLSRRTLTAVLAPR